MPISVRRRIVISAGVLAALGAAPATAASVHHGSRVHRAAARHLAPRDTINPSVPADEFTTARGLNLGGPLAYDITTVGPYGGEPALAADPNGILYDSTPSGGTITYRSTDKGENWTKVGTADKNSGDDCLATDQAGSVYLCNLAGSPSKAPLQADAFKSTDFGKTWKYGDQPPVTNGPAGNVCGTSCNPFGVDRDWMDAYIPKGGDTNSANVVLMYHDFYGPSQIWVNLSNDGGRTYGPSQDIMTHFRVTDADKVVLSQIYNSCSTVPIGLQIAKGGPHPGRVFAAWIASDPQSAVTGCNTSQFQSFHTVFVAYSDDGGNTWTPQEAYDAGVGHDASSPFAGFTLDDQGNPYVALTTNQPSENPETCAAEGLAGTVQSDPSCAYHMFVVWSQDGGDIYNGGGGLIPGSAAKPYEVDVPQVAQTDLYPAIAAGDPGRVEVVWLRTNEIAPTGPLGKLNPGACAGPGPANGNPATYPPACNWNLMAAQSTNLYAPVANAKWTITQVSQQPMHVGDICNLGIACAAPASNRNLLDFISEVVDPTTGYAHIAWQDDNQINKLLASNQISGPSLYTRSDNDK